MTIDEAIAFCNEKSKNIKLKAEPEVFEYISSLLTEFKELRKTKSCEYESATGKCTLNECMYEPITDKDKYNLCESVRKSLDDNRLKEKHNE